MDDLISREAAIDAIVSVTVFPDADYIKNLCENPSNSEDWLGGVCEAINAMEEVDAVDAVPVVRCRDCKHFIDMSGTSYPSYCYKHSTFDAEGEFDNAFSVEPNKYCAWGERRDDDGKDA